jgi:glycosyltransferase involved in cell wall biosynthesis
VVGRHDETALLVPPGDPEALAAAINRLLDDPDLRARIGTAGRGRVFERYTWAATAKGTVEQYRAELSAHAARRAGKADRPC